jgi:hypothetical protein
MYNSFQGKNVAATVVDVPRLVQASGDHEDLRSYLQAVSISFLCSLLLTLLDKLVRIYQYMCAI